MIMHLVMAMMMNLENFSLACVTALIVFFTHELWDWLKAAFRVRGKHRGDKYDPAVYFLEDTDTLGLRIWLQLVVWDCVDIHEMRLKDHKEELKGVNSSEHTWVLRTEGGEFHTGMRAVYELCGLSPLSCLFSLPIGRLWKSARKHSPSEQSLTMKSVAKAGSLTVAYHMAVRFFFLLLALALMVMVGVTSYEDVTAGDPETNIDARLDLTNPWEWEWDVYRVWNHKLGQSGRWNMFDSPARECGWYQLPVRMIKDSPYKGALLDAHKLRHYPELAPTLDWQRPEYPAFQHRSSLWHSFYELLFTRIRDDIPHMHFLLESLSRYYCRHYPIRVFGVVFSTERYNFTNLDEGRTVLSNNTLWSKSCVEYDGSGGVPERHLHDNKPRWGPTLNWFTGMPKPYSDWRGRI